MITEASLKKALANRVREKSKAISIVLKDHLFSQQLKFIEDPSAFKVAVCSRRAGKSTGVAADLVKTAYDNPECTALYITGTRSDAKKIIWREILKFNREKNLGGVANISELTLSFKNGSLVRLAGAKDEQEIEKIRGQLPPIKKVFIDEGQSIRDSVLKKLIDDVLEAALMDYAASMTILGTPGAVETGYFYRVAHNLGEDGRPLPEPVWATHKWTFFDNPWLPIKSKKTHQQLLDRVLKRRGVKEDHPSIQREFFGNWVGDTDSLLIHYDRLKNDYVSVPSPEKMTYILGVDIGFNDADALAVLAWGEHTPNVYLVEEILKNKQDITELMNCIQELRKKYPISKMVIDAGALGKKITEELIRRHQIPLEAAEKSRKMENVALLNDFLRTGRFKAKPDSKFAQDSFLVEIDRDKSTPDRIKISERYHSDIIDAVLYAFKVSYAYTFQEQAKKPKYGSKEWAEQQSNDMFEAELQGLQSEYDKEKFGYSD